MDESIAKGHTYSIFDEDGTPFAFNISHEELWDWARISNLIIYYKNGIPYLARTSDIIGTKYRIEAI